MKPPRERRRPLDGAVNPNAETASQQGPVSDQDAERHERIAVAAYYNAERRGFRDGGEQDDWLEAEREIERQDRKRTPPPRIQDEISSPDHMVAREPLPAGQPHDPVPKPANPSAAMKKPERRKSARAR
jgi:hypothetical protein